jgi:hypothetical protein
VSPFLLIKALETQLRGTLSRLDVASLPHGEQKLVTTLRNDLVDARLDVRDYELSETREEQIRKMKEAKARLTKVRKEILAASEYNIFSAVDVAQISAQIEQIIEKLE